jgi:hypothetical protein
LARFKRVRRGRSQGGDERNVVFASALDPRKLDLQVRDGKLSKRACQGKAFAKAAKRRGHGGGCLFAKRGSDLAVARQLGVGVATLYGVFLRRSKTEIKGFFATQLALGGDRDSINPHDRSSQEHVPHASSRTNQK